MNLRGLFNDKTIFAEQLWFFLTHSCKDKGGSYFPMERYEPPYLKVNAIGL